MLRTDAQDAEYASAKSAGTAGLQGWHVMAFKIEEVVLISALASLAFYSFLLAAFMVGNAHGIGVGSQIVFQSFSEIRDAGACTACKIATEQEGRKWFSELRNTW